MMDNTVCSLGRRLLLPLLLPLLFVCGMCTIAQAQITSLANESFKKSLPQGWSVYPASTPTAPTWASDTHVTASGKYAMHGYVPFNVGDSVELVTPIYDCSKYKHVMLKFGHICKVLPADVCQVMFREDYVGSHWKPIPSDAYRGKSSTYKTTLSFDHGCYTEWMGADSFAIPSAGWYKEEAFDLSDYASYRIVQFKFVIKKGVFFNSFVADGWYIDDFQLYAHASIELNQPKVAFITVYNAIQNTTGPFVINAKVATRTAAPIIHPYLHYSATYNNKTTSDSICMIDMDGGDSLWTATIPQQLYGSDVSYYIVGRDTIGNSSKESSTFCLKRADVRYDSNSAALYAVENPKAGTPSGRQPVIVNVKNKGLKDMTSLRIGWSVNGVIQSAKNWKGNLPCDFNDTITLGYYTQSSHTYDTIVAWVEMPNGVTDSITTDDTLTVVSYGCDSSLQGIYTVGAGGKYDFATIEDALFTLRTCGMSGDVEFRMASGIYKNSIALNGNIYNAVIGSHHLCFTSMAHHPDSVLWYNGVDLQGMKNVSFKLLGFDMGTLSSSCVNMNGCEDVEIYRCNMTAKVSIYVVYVNTSNHIRLRGNQIVTEFGSYGIYCYGAGNASRNRDIVCDSNRIIGGVNYMVHFQYLRNVCFARNVMENSCGNSILAAYFAYIDSCMVDANIIRMHTPGYGIYVHRLDSTSVVSNNEIVNVNCSGSRSYGIYFYQNTGARLLHNSTLMYGTGTFYGIYNATNTTAYRGVFRNNLTITYGKNSYPFYSSGWVGNSDMDYNNWWGERYVGYVGKAVTDMSEFVQLIPSAMHDVSYRPQFKDSSASLDFVWRGGLGCPLDSHALTAINGPRGTSTVMGAWTKSVNGKTDLAVVDILSPHRYGEIVHDTVPVRIVIRNVGLDTITSAQVACRLNGLTGSSYVWKGRLLPMGEDTLTLGSIRLNVTSNQFAAYCYQPNGVKDACQENDTITMRLLACDSALIGVYTVGDSLSDYRNMTDVIQSLKQCGVRGPVEFHIANGTYSGIAIEDSIPGSNARNTITFKAEKGKRDSVVFIQDGNGVALALRNISHLIFENLTFSGNIKGVEMEDAIRNVTIRNCAVSAPAGIANSTYCAIFYNGGNSKQPMLDGVRLVGNRIDGGYYNIYITNACNGFAEAGKGAGIVIDSNLFSNGYAYGVYIYWYGNYRSFSHNTVTCELGDTSFTGLYSYMSSFRQIEGNKLHLDRTNYTLNGLYIVGTRAQDDTCSCPLMACNNEIILTGNGAQYGIYLDYLRGRMELVHNSIHCAANNSNNMCIRLAHSIFPSVVRNNICRTSAGYPLYSMNTGFGMADSSIIRDYNTYCSPGNLAWLNGKTISSISMLHKMDSLNDRHSNVLDPCWDVNEGLKPDMPINHVCPVYPGVTEDINGKKRPAQGTIMGCHQLSSDSMDASLLSFEGWSGFVSATASPLYAVVQNKGLKPIDSASFVLWIDSVQQPVIRYRPSSPLAMLQQDTVLLGKYMLADGPHTFIAYVDMAGDTCTLNDTITVSRIICRSAFAGKYIIGNSAKADFTYSQLMDSLIPVMNDCGVSGDMTFAFESGEYRGALDLSDIALAMGNHHLTITSVAKNRDSVCISNDGPTLIVGENNRNVTVEHLTFKYTVPTNYVVWLKQGCQNILLKYNNLLGDTTVNGTITIYCNTSGYSPVSVSVVGNYIQAGNQGIYFAASSDAMNQLLIDSNIIAGQYGYGCHLTCCHLRSFSYNQIRSRSNGNTSYIGVYMASCTADTLIGNRLDISGTHGFYLHEVRSSVGGHCFMANNTVRLKCPNANNTSYGVYVYNSQLLHLHNTLYQTSAGGYAFFGGSAFANFSRLEGNMFVVESGSVPLYLYNTGLYNTNYNNYYGGATVAQVGNTICSTLVNLKVVNGMDANSISAAVSFKNPSRDLSIRNGSPVFIHRLPEVNTDIDNKPRRKITSMGAYETEASALDAALVDFAQTKVRIGSSAVSVTLANYGMDTLRSATLYWVANNVAQTPVQWIGRLTIGESAVVNLGSFNGKPTDNTIVAWVGNPNQNKDMVPANDTVSLSDFLCNGTLSGKYTVGGLNPDFATPEIMQAALYRCGVSGPVEMRFRSGVYSTLSLSDSIPGSNSVNRITFTTDSGLVAFKSEYSLLLKNVSHMVFRGLSFGDTVLSNDGVIMEGNCTNVTLRECDLYAMTSTSSGSASFRYSVGRPTNVRLIGNRLYNGYANVHISASGATETNGADIVIDSNVMEGASYYGILFASSGWKSSSISFNTIHLCRKISGGTFYGIYMRGTSWFDRIEGNRILIEHTGGSTAYGISFIDVNGLNGVHAGMIVNNDIRVVGAGVSYGIYANVTQTTANFHHNSIWVKSQQTAYGIWTGVEFALFGTNQNNQITRNLIVAEGKTASYPLYIYDVALLHPHQPRPVQYGINYNKRSYNNLYSSTNVAYAGSAMTTISALQNATKQDSFSVSMLPYFIDTTNDLNLGRFDSLDCPSIPEVPYDINGFLRTGITSMGAYGVRMHEDVNLQAIAFISPQPVTGVECLPDSVPVALTIRNMGFATAYFDSSALKVSVDVTGATTMHWDTLVTAGMLKHRGQMSFVLGMLPTSAGGRCTLTAILSCAADSVPEDDTLRMSYNASRVELPYDVDFSTEPEEFVNGDHWGGDGWQVVQDTGTHPLAVPAFGTGRLEFAGFGHSGATANAIFNGVNLKGCLNPKLSFWYAHDATDSKRDLMFVLATTDGGATYTEIGRITAAAATTGWQQYDIDLSRFANASCLSIVFQAISFGGADQSIDRIRISADADAAITLLPVELGTLTACNNDAVPLRAVITNQTALPFAYSSDTVTAEVTGATTQSFSYVYNKQLGGYETDTVTLGNMDLRANGNYYVNVYMQSQDDNALNDTVSDSTLHIWQDLALDSIIGIDAQTQHLGGDTVWVSALVRNRSNLEADRFTLRMSLNGALVAEDTVYAPLSAGDTMTHAMSLPYVVPFADKEQPYYFLELSVTLPCDGDSANDLRSVVGAVHVPDTVDLQLLSIARPADTLGRKKVSPVVRLANIGNADVQDVMLHVEVLDSAMGLLDNISETVNFIRSNDTAEHVFALTYAVPDYDGRYWLHAYVERHADELDPANDTLLASFSCKRNNIGIARHDGEGWNLGQNETNPASSVTAIPFNVPLDGRVVLSVMGVNGQLLHREEIDATTGANRVELQLETLPAGLYYYSLEYRGQRQVRKMTVIK